MQNAFFKLRFRGFFSIAKYGLFAVSIFSKICFTNSMAKSYSGSAISIDRIMKRNDSKPRRSWLVSSNLLLRTYRICFSPSSGYTVPSMRNTWRKKSST